MTGQLDPNLDPNEGNSSPIDATIDPAPAAPGPLFVDQGGELKSPTVAQPPEPAIAQPRPVAPPSALETTPSAPGKAPSALNKAASAPGQPASVSGRPASAPGEPAPALAQAARRKANHPPALLANQHRRKAIHHRHWPTSTGARQSTTVAQPPGTVDRPTRAGHFQATFDAETTSFGAGARASDGRTRAIRQRRFARQRFRLETVSLGEVPVRPFVALAERPQAVLGSGPAAVFPVPIEPTRAALGTDVVTCPECGQLATVDMARRQADDFCRRCDFPLFWARGTVIAPEGAESGASLRRLPGTVGRAATAALICPHCSEPNSPAAEICVRCALSLHPVDIPEPEPVVIAPPEPEPEPEPLPEKSFDWWWIVAIAAALVAIALLVGLLYLR